MSFLTKALLRLFERREQQLTQTGFEIAFGMALARYWPGTTVGEARSWLWDYIGVPFGTAGFLWTTGAALDLARQYANEFGEGAA